jgi:hypothetical protein
MRLARQDHDDIARAQLHGSTRHAGDIGGTFQQGIQINFFVVGH